MQSRRSSPHTALPLTPSDVVKSNIVLALHLALYSPSLSPSRLAWPFEKQNAPCLPLLHIAISRTAAWPEWMEVHRANGHTHHSDCSLAPCIKRAIYFFFSLLFLGTAAPTLSCQIKFIGGTTPTTKRRVWREAELKKVTKNEEIAESARDHREVLEYFIATPREFRPRSIVFCFVPHSPNPWSSARSMCVGEGRADAATATGDCRNSTLCQNDY